MRRISAQYIFTASGDPLKRGVITTDDDGTIISVEDTGGNLEESASTEFYNGIIIPGLINCHCHLELSHMAGSIPGGHGLADFITAVRETREVSEEEIIVQAQKADNEMYLSGVVACGDICNNHLTFSIKNKSHIEYISFIEVFGIDPAKAEKRIESAVTVAAAAAAAGLCHHITPHAVYSVSQQLFSLLSQHISPASLTSLHFLESDEERDLVSRRRGRLIDSYKPLGITSHNLNSPTDHLKTALSLAQMTGQLILAHNTCIRSEEVTSLYNEQNIWFCLCPLSNMYISGNMPPVDIIRQASDKIITGTDSLASNNHLSIFGELKMLHDHNPDIPLDEIISWGTINGARALRLEKTLGSIEPGKKPGLLLVEGVDFSCMRLLAGSRVKRIL